MQAESPDTGTKEKIPGSHKRQSERTPKDISRLPSFDGWRAVSIAMVIIPHSEKSVGFPREALQTVTFFCGDLGVRFFFTISGFLITWRMLMEFEGAGEISLKNFYIRRAFRILPVYAAFLGTVFLLQLFTSYHQSPGQWAANLTFTTNYVRVPWTVNHLWSLAVEEQFYLLWPILVVTLGLATMFKRAINVILPALVIAPIFRVIVHRHYYPETISFLFSGGSFFRYFDTLALGCGCAILMAKRTDDVYEFFRNNGKWVPVAGLILLFMPPFLTWTPVSIQAAADNTLQAVDFALLLMHSVISPDSKGYRWLNWKWVSYLGVLSYSLYLWQEIFAAGPQPFGFGNAWWMAFPCWWFIALLVAIISYHGLERPFLALGRRIAPFPSDRKH